MRRRRYIPNTSALVEHVQHVGWITVKSDSAQSAQDYFEACQDAGLPAVIVVIPRTSANVEYFASPHGKLSMAAQDQIRQYAEVAFMGSISKKRVVTIGHDSGVVRGVHRDQAMTFAAMLADVLRDETSYRQGKVVMFPGHRKMGDAA